MKAKHFLAVPKLMAASYFMAGSLQLPVQGQSLLPQGNFEQVEAGNKPAGWKLGTPQNTAVAGDANNHWVQLRDGAILTHVLRLPVEAKKVVVSGRFKLSNYVKGPESWHRPRIAMRFLDEQGNMVGTYPPTPDVAGDTDWTTKQVTLDVPQGATQLQLEPGLWGSKGLLEMDDIIVKAYEAGAVIEAAPKIESAVDAAWPANVKTHWGEEPVEVLSARRARINLNGAWKFSPAQGSATTPNQAPQGGWGYIQVPGNWRRPQERFASGTGPQWNGFDGRKLAGAWYERRFKVPADWDGSHISLDFQRVSTDATVWVNDKPAGKINWPEGELDITKLVAAGQEVTLRAFVVATINEGEVMVLMGDAPGQNYTAKADLLSAGIVGNVTLQSRPEGAYLSDVYVKPSTRKKQLGVDVEFSNVTQEGAVQLVGSMLDESGKEEKQFTQTVNLKAAPTQRVQFDWEWSNPRLWDYNQPNLYSLRLSAKGAGVDDEPAITFGFREMWTQGRDIYLNGIPFRTRPFLVGGNASTEGATRLKEAGELGYNFGEIWPEDIEARSRDVRFTDWFEVADRAGFPISGILPHMGWMGNNLQTPEKTALYRTQVERVLRRYRNHPSIVMWGTSGNMMGGSRDPRYVGVREEANRTEMARNSNLVKAIPLGEKGIGIIKSLDNTRPVFIHNGGAVGDIYTLNNYLNFIPLQEREEWLSSYVQKGDMPLMYVEFGTPVSLSLMRARNGFTNAMVSEMFLSEYSAIYLGADAYRLEPSAYRKRTTELYQKDQTYAWSLGMKERDYAPAWLKLQDDFIRNTWRSWRTMGITGGMIPWDSGYVKLDNQMTLAGNAMRTNNGSTLAWIAGAAQSGDVAAFTSKDHSYFVGEKVRKQIALLNDSRTPQNYSLRWSAALGGKTIASGTKSGMLAVGQNLFVPFEFPAPAAKIKTGGAITLEATIGTTKHNDHFDYRVWPRVSASKGSIVVFDPEGKTGAMLRGMGYTITSWNGKATTSLLVIGRNALKNGAKLPGNLESFVQGGGRVLLSGHDPHWLRENIGVRVSYLQSRRVFKIADTAPVRGIDELDMRDWRGQSTMLNPRPDYINGSGPDVRLAPTTYPYTGWRWGNRGTVASASVEKPHRSGWRPLLESEFDLGYSPLMELDFGRGKVIWSQLDLEDHAGLDPAAARITRQLVEYATKAPVAPRLPVTYLGGEAGSSLLRSLGLQFQSATTLPASGVAIIGADANISDENVEAFARGGGRVMFMPRRNAQGAAGLQLQEKTDFVGSIQPPNWPEARGLSASDLRWRNTHSAWIVAGGQGWQVAADGLLARRVIGKGVLLWSQIDPTWLPADEKTYFRLTRWRQTRAVTQILANLGASFEMDARIFAPRAEVKLPVVKIGGDWHARQIQRLVAAPSPDAGPEDKGISVEAKRAVQADFDDSAWQVVPVPRDMDSYVGTWVNADGEAVFRKVVEVPQALVGQDLKLSLGPLDDFDDTYFNGVRIGGLGKETDAAYGVKRDYAIPANLVKAGKNVIAVRVWDRYGGGGFTSNDVNALLLQSARSEVKVAGFYHSDYREDWALGDEPYRYYNW